MQIHNTNTKKYKTQTQNTNTNHAAHILLENTVKLTDQDTKHPVRRYSAQIKIQICTNTKHKTQTQNTNTKNIMHILWDNTLLSQIKIQNRRYENILLDNALLIDQDTNKYKYKYLFKEAQITNYPQRICKRSWKFPFPSSWFVSWPPFRCATTVNAQFVVIFEDCSHHGSCADEISVIILKCKNQPSIMPIPMLETVTTRFKPTHSGALKPLLLPEELQYVCTAGS